MNISEPRDPELYRLLRVQSESLSIGEVIYSKIKDINFFKKLFDRLDPLLIYRTCQKLNYERFEKGKVIFMENDPFNGIMYYVISGKILILKKTKNPMYNSARKTAIELSLMDSSKKNENSPLEKMRGHTKSTFIPNSNLSKRIEIELKNSNKKEEKITSRFSNFLEVQSPQIQRIKSNPNLQETPLENRRISRAFNSAIAEEMKSQRTSALDINEVEDLISKYGGLIRVMTKGEVLGDISFMTLKSRTATCIVQETADVITLSKDDFKEIQENFVKVHKVKRELVSSAFSFPLNFSSSVIDNFLLSFREMSVNKGVVIAKEEDKGEMVYVIVSGDIVIMQKNVTICHTSKGAIVGEELLFDSEKYTYTCIVNSTKASFLISNVNVLDQKMPKEVRESLQKARKNKKLSRSSIFSQAKTRKNYSFNDFSNVDAPSMFRISTKSKLESYMEVPYNIPSHIVSKGIKEGFISIPESIKIKKNIQRKYFHSLEIKGKNPYNLGFGESDNIKKTAEAKLKKFLRGNSNNSSPISGTKKKKSQEYEILLSADQELKKKFYSSSNSKISVFPQQRVSDFAEKIDNKSIIPFQFSTFKTFKSQEAGNIVVYKSEMHKRIFKPTIKSRANSAYSLNINDLKINN